MKKKTLSKEEMILFARQLALAIQSDISLTQALSLIAEKSDHEELKKVLVDIVNQLHEGKPFSEAISLHEEYLSSFFVQMVVIGEESGTLPDTLTQIAASYEKQIESSNKMKAAVTYPIILTALMFGVIVLLVVQVMPMFNDVLRSIGGELPPLTKMIMNASLFLKKYAVLFLGLLLLVFVFFAFYGKTEKGKLFYDRMTLKLPVVRELTSALLAARFSRNLGLLIGSGMSLSQAFGLIRPTMNNRYLEEMIDQGAKELNEGKGLDEVIEGMKLFPWLLMKLFSVAAETGQMDKALLTAAVEMEKEVDLRLSKLTTVVEPLLIIILSIIVGVILISVVLPVVNIMNSIG
ncbi:MAG: type II secretion system F family protein [Vallitaleaceae bacterium]|nr:type II secretion system F family protein [Vallitaleaceae bacterium]